MTAPRLAPLALLALLAPGCFHVHGERNAPAHVSLEEPTEERVQERDPGERLLLLGAGVLGGLGVVGTGGGPDAAGLFGLEATALLGANDVSHSEDGLVWPSSGLGLNGGLSLGLFGRERSRGTGYVELVALSEGGAIAGGWAFPVLREATGPQATLSLGPLFVRGAYLLDAGGELTVGFAVKPYGLFTWSR